VNLPSGFPDREFAVGRSRLPVEYSGCTFVSTKVPKTPTQKEGMAHSGIAKCKKANFDSNK